MPSELLHLVKTLSLPATEVRDRTAEIHAAALRESAYLDAANFTCVHPDDLELLFDLYDQHFFAGQVKNLLGAAPLEFSLSKRMTRSGGSTTRFHHRATGHRRYKISVATTLLFQCFAGKDHRPIVCSGITCRNRLDAMQRVMEHEITHLIEMLLWEKSSCAKSRFHSITLRFFSHTENTHQMITPRERAFVQFGIKPGVQVRFRFDGIERVGVVNRVNKRATVLVEDAQGEPYSNGKRYAKFYVPMQMLKPVEPDS